MNLNEFVKQRPIHLILFPLLFIVNHFFAIITPTDSTLIQSTWAWIFNFTGAVIVCCGLPFLIYKLLGIKFNRTKSAILTTVLFLPLFFFQDFFLSFDFLFLGLRARLIFPVIFVALAALCFWIIKAHKNFHTLTQYLNMVSLLMLLYTSIAVLFADDLRPNVLTYSPTIDTLKCSPCPDIYLILLDSYTSNKSLQDHFQFDNTDFTKQLQAMDFTVSNEAISSYSRTGYSLAAILNLDQIHQMDQYNFGIGEAIRSGSVIRTLKEANYEIHNYSIFDVDDQPKYYTVNPSFQIGFINGIVQSCLLNIIVYDVAMKFRLYGIHTEILEKVRQQAAKRENRPRFVYTHLLCPHPPFVMNDKGEGISFFRQPKNMANPVAYVAQVKGLNKIVAATVENIRQSSPTAVIIITGDHGYRYLTTAAKDKESFTVFLAYHGPNQQELDSLSSSNEIFRLLFNTRR